MPLALRGRQRVGAHQPRGLVGLPAPVLQASDLLLQLPAALSQALAMSPALTECLAQGVQLSLQGTQLLRLACGWDTAWRLGVTAGCPRHR